MLSALMPYAAVAALLAAAPGDRGRDAPPTRTADPAGAAAASSASTVSGRPTGLRGSPPVCAAASSDWARRVLALIICSMLEKSWLSAICCWA